MAGLIYAITLVPSNPDAPLAVLASFIPFTSPIVLPTRLAFTAVPPWQTAVGLVLLWGSSVLGMWLLSRLVKRNLVGYSDRFRFFRWLWHQWRPAKPEREAGARP
jgi:ABC-2 type transport system permease protein